MADGASKDGTIAAKPGIAGAPNLDETYRRYWAELCDFVAKTFGAGPPEPEDVVQTAFARFAAVKEPADIENPRAYLYRTARNIALDQRRRQGVQRRYVEELGKSPEKICDVLDPERVLISREEFAILDTAIRALPVRTRDFLLLRQLGGLSYTQIAARYGMSRNGVKRIVVQGLAACEAALEKAQKRS